MCRQSPEREDARSRGRTLESHTGPVLLLERGKSLGEALMTAGELGAAIASYRISLELNPANGNAVEMIEKIESMG